MFEDMDWYLVGPAVYNLGRMQEGVGPSSGGEWVPDAESSMGRLIPPFLDGICWYTAANAMIYSNKLGSAPLGGRVKAVEDAREEWLRRGWNAGNTVRREALYNVLIHL